jgi:putative endonuclease
MYYVYLLRSIKNPTATYVGYTNNLEERLKRHNAGRVRRSFMRSLDGSVHTQNDKPWAIVTYVAFSNEQKALDFEKYVKVGSGYAFAKKRLW